MRKLLSFLLALMFFILAAGMSFAVDKKEEVHPLTIALPGILLIGLGAAIFFTSQQHQGMTVATVGDDSVTLQNIAQVFGVLWASVGVALGIWGGVEAMSN